MQCSRRNFLLTSLAALLPAPPTQAIGLPIIFRALKLIDDLVEAVDGVMVVVKWTKDATKKLDDLVNMSVGITDELKQINILLKKSDFPDFVENNLNANIRQFKINLTELEDYKNQKPETHTRIALLTDHLESNALLSLEYGAAAYETTYTAAIVVRALYKYIDMPHDHQKQFFTTVADRFNAWLDPSKEDTPAALRHKEQVQIERNQKQASDIKDKYKGHFEILGDLDTDFKINKLSKYYPSVITGDPESELKKLIADYRGHRKTIADLDEVIAQLEQYHESLIGVAKGRRLALREENKHRPSDRLQ